MTCYVCVTLIGQHYALSQTKKMTIWAIAPTQMSQRRDSVNQTCRSSQIRHRRQLPNAHRGYEKIDGGLGIS